ncbi:hypothetical protein ACTFIZ_004607 [Dictyostelium cf. discoideum]
MGDNIVINLKNVSRSYGNVKVIEKLNFTINKGTINSLIGSSGSGKTTILKTILGKLKQDDGMVQVFGKEPCEKGSEIPGSSVGYSPQDICLYNEITIEETLSFFASIHRMSKQEYIKKRDSLVEILELPSLSKIISELSGGQQRRVSLATALIHSPKLLILDEPTVGVCPLVSSKIWEHLIFLTKNYGVTIIITTHYLQECRSCDNLFLLRNGRILESGPPNYLLSKYECSLLEEVYYKLCRNDEEISLQLIETKNNEEINNISLPLNEFISNGANINNNNNDILISNTNISIIQKEANIYKENWNDFLYKIKIWFLHSITISKRKLIQMYRLKFPLIFEVISPSLLITLFFLAIGNAPHDLKFGIKNFDSGSLSSDFINALSEGNNIFNFIQINDTSNAIQMIESSDLWGLIDIPVNFTNGMVNKLFNPLEKPFENSEMEIYMDLSNFQMNLMVDVQFQKAFNKIANDSGMKLLPTNFHAVYGDQNVNFNWFLAPAMICIITYVHCMNFLSITFVREKNDGTRDKILLYGVSSISNVLGHIIAHIPILFVQFSIQLLIAVFAFNVPIKGNIVLIYFFFFLINTVGMCQGILISLISKAEVDAVQLCLAIFICSLCMAGIIWPTEAIITFGWVSNLVPTKWSGLALRGLMIKDLPFTHQHIWKSLIIIISYIIGTFSLIVITTPIGDRNFNFKKLFKRIK